MFSRFRCAILAFALLAAGCGKRQTPVEAGIAQGILHIGNGSEPRDLDPDIAISATESRILAALYEALINYSADSHTILPGAAERWDISSDGKNYTFHLRNDLKWSNGDPLTAEDFRYSFLRLIEPELGAENAVYLDWVVGAQDYRLGKTHDLAAVGIRAPDAQTLEITLNARAPFFLGMLALNPFYPLYRPAIEKVGGRLKRGGTWTQPGALITNGPFFLKAWHINESLVTEKNEHYWDAAHTRLHEVIFHPIENIDTEERNFRGGLLHITRYVPVVKLDALRKAKSPLLKVDPLIANKYVTFSTTKPPFTDARVRRAFGMSVDRVALVEQVMREGGRVANSLTVPGSGLPPYTSRSALVYDPAAARALLAEAGFPNGANFPNVVMTFTSAHQGEQQLVEAMQAMWQKELGVHVNLVAQEEKVWLDTLRTKNFQMLVDGWSSSFNDPVDMFQLFKGDSPNNDAGWVSAAYDSEYDAAAQAPDDTAREVHLQTMDAVLIEQMPMIPLFYRSQNYLVHPAVHGWSENMLDWHPFQSVWLEAPAAPGAAPK